MKRLNALAVAAILAVASASAIAGHKHSVNNAVARGTVSGQLVGGWRLVSRVTRTADGQIVVDPSLSATPKGVLIYDATGHVAAQLSRPGRTLQTILDDCADVAKVKGTQDTAQTILGYDAYFGTYKVDEEKMTVTHHLESALFPEDVGKDILRHFSIAGNTLVIIFPTTQRDGSPVTRTLTWTRMQ
jgi:hypothetical protein